MTRRILALVLTIASLSLCVAMAGAIFDPVLGKLRSDVAATTPDGGTISAAGGNTAANTVTAETTAGASSSAGTSDEYSRGDHTHGTPAVPTAAATGAVATTGNETVAGVKTFSSSPVVPTPTTDTQAANKVYVDTLAAGLSVRESVVAATAAAGTLASDFENGDTIDTSVTLATGNRILIKNQADGAENGIYVVAETGAPTRATDYDTAGEAAKGSFCTVLTGTANANTQWVNATQTTPIVLGTTPLVFSQLSTSAGFTASLGVEKVGSDFRADLKANDGLALDGNEIKVDYDNTTIGIVANKVAVKAGGLTEANMATVATGVLNDPGRVNGAGITGLASLPAGAGIVPVANLGTGTPDTSTYLRGDGSWQALSGGGAGGSTVDVPIALTSTNSAQSIAGSATVDFGGTSTSYWSRCKLNMANATHVRVVTKSYASSGSALLLRPVYTTTATTQTSACTDMAATPQAADLTLGTTNVVTAGAWAAIDPLAITAGDVWFSLAVVNTSGFITTINMRQTYIEIRYSVGSAADSLINSDTKTLTDAGGTRFDLLRWSPTAGQAITIGGQVTIVTANCAQLQPVTQFEFVLKATDDVGYVHIVGSDNFSTDYFHWGRNGTDTRYRLALYGTADTDYTAYAFVTFWYSGTYDIAPVVPADNVGNAITAFTYDTIGGVGYAGNLTAGTGAGNLVQLDGSARLPAVDGSQLTGISSFSGAAGDLTFTAADKTVGSSTLSDGGINANTALGILCNGTTTSFVDSSTNAFTVTNGTDATQTASNVKSGFTKCGLFDGVNDMITVPDNALWNLEGNNRTIEAWIRPTLTGYNMIVEQGAGTTDRWLLFMNASDQLSFLVTTSDATNISMTGATTITLNTWHHVAAVVTSGGAGYLFLDGTQEDTDTITGTIGDFPTVVRWGNDHTGTIPFHGQMDQMCIFTTAKWTSGFTPSATEYNTGTYSTAEYAWTAFTRDTLMPLASASAYASALGLGTEDSPTFTAATLTGSGGLTLGTDAATNTAGFLKMWGAGANDYYTTFTAGTQTASVAYTLPTADGAAGAKLATNGSGVLSWEAIGTTYAAYAAGTAYSLTDTAALLNFGTTDPTVTLTDGGTYRLTCIVTLAYTGATVATETAALKLRRTNNTPADITNATITIDLPVATTLTHTYGTVTLPPVIYTSTAGDVIEAWGSVSAALQAGTIDAAGCTILAERIK